MYKWFKLTMNALCQVWLKIAKWLWGRRWKHSNSLTDGRIVHFSIHLRWAKKKTWSSFTWSRWQWAVVLQRPDKQTWHYLLQWLWQSHLGRDSALALTELKKQEHSNVYSLYSPKSNFHPFCPNHQWTNCNLGNFFLFNVIEQKHNFFQILDGAK